METHLPLLLDEATTLSEAVVTPATKTYPHREENTCSSSLAVTYDSNYRLWCRGIRPSTKDISESKDERPQRRSIFS
ncbi:hypothetical protein HZH66_011810 [Vespula vulgaris]|uniref:Uncharacterized protein n=1 Tax=Vespula vulgaris TaxID=7454 RepID=A0A834MWS7_VESVU|nr:hypothetical protein HZH66_011810 [Vespula vulgaris]